MTRQDIEIEKYVIPFSKGGLGGRLKCLLYSKEIFSNTKRKILLYWENNKYCNCNFSDLFDKDIVEISKEELREIIKRDNFQILTKDIDNEKKYILIGDLGRAFAGFYGSLDIPLGEKLKELNIKKEIQEEINQYKLPEDVIGVHIRRGDFRTIPVGEVSTDERFIEAMKKEIKLNKRVVFFLATDEKETEDKFKRIFGNKIISHTKQIEENSFREGTIKDALIELLLLSKCKKILGSFGSTFLEIAWEFGYRIPKIIIVKDEERLKICKVKERGKDNWFNQIKKMIYETITPLHIRLLDKI